MLLRKYRTSDCEEVIKLFYNTVHTINAKDYTKTQLDIWAPKQLDSKEWDRSLQKHHSLVALSHTIIIGFGDIDETGYLDRLFVHTDYQRRGVAAAICNELEQAVNTDTITVCASITAKPFFENRGYQVVRKQQVLKGGVFFTNYFMKKQCCNSDINIKASE